MSKPVYDKIPIVDTARRCGLALDSRTLRRREVEAACPFCHDHGPGKYHLSLNTRDMTNGTRSYSWVHVTGNTSSERAFLTEGPLKGDVASYLMNDALFICIGGVNAIGGLQDTIRTLGVKEVVEAMDADQMVNPHVRNAILAMRKEVRRIQGIRYLKYSWDPAYKGVDDYLLSRVATG